MMDPLFSNDWPIRLPLYIIFGIVCEFLFTSTADLIKPNFVKSWNVVADKATVSPPDWRLRGRDPRLMGYSFLWMIPIYALLIFIEPAGRLLSPLPFYLRGIIYVIALWIVEYTTGFLIKKISGRCPWDYSASRFNLHGYIRWDFFPFWFVFMLSAEWLSSKFVLLTPAIKALF
ncbi:MAG: hypothetical protein HY541_00045 [Deltaproteobacteria bacterium]|nr:hypothetical protein [Deltaproteobacteria bacterium]